MTITHIKPLTNLQKELAANYTFFASHRSYGYDLSQEKVYFACQLLFSNFCEDLI